MTLEFALSCDADTAQATLSDVDFIVQRSMDLGELSASAEVQERDDMVVVEQERRVHRDLPSALRKLFSGEQDMKVTETWTAYDDGSWSCDQLIEILEQPVTIYGDIRIEADGERCLYRVEQRAKARVPLLGHSVERYVLREAERTVTKEMEYLQASVAS